MSCHDTSDSPFALHPNTFFVIHLLLSYSVLSTSTFLLLYPFLLFFFISHFFDFSLCIHHSYCFIIRLACVLVKIQCLFLQMVHCPLVLSTAAPTLLTELAIKHDCQVHSAALLLLGCIPRLGKSRDMLLYTQPNPTQTVANAFTQKGKKRGGGIKDLKPMAGDK